LQSRLSAARHVHLAPRTPYTSFRPCEHVNPGEMHDHAVQCPRNSEPCHPISLSIAIQTHPIPSEPKQSIRRVYCHSFLPPIPFDHSDIRQACPSFVVTSGLTRIIQQGATETERPHHRKFPPRCCRRADTLETGSPAFSFCPRTDRPTVYTYILHPALSLDSPPRRICPFDRSACL
jgi:hypothetical protein